MEKIALYAGSFNPFHVGHLWMVEQGSKLFDKLIVCVATNPDKEEANTTELMEDISSIILPKFTNVEVVRYTDSLIVNLAKKYNANFLLRGIRNTNDFVYEKDMKEYNNDLCSDIVTVFLIPPSNLCHISSSAIRGLKKLGEDKRYLPPVKKVFKVGLTGNICSGKSKVSKIFKGFGCNIIDSDTIAKEYIATIPNEIAKIVPEAVEDNKVIYKKLAEVVFSNEEKLNRLEEIVHKHVFSEIERLCNPDKINIVESAIIFEKGFENRFDKTIVVSISYKRALEYSKLRGMKKDDFDKRWEKQNDCDRKYVEADYLIDNSKDDFGDKLGIADVYIQLADDFNNFLLKRKN